MHIPEAKDLSQSSWRYSTELVLKLMEALDELIIDGTQLAP